MRGVAVAIVGVPEGALKVVRQRLQKEFPNGYVIRSKAARLNSSKMASYGGAEISDATELLSDAVFGSSRRPVGFCRNSQRPCASISKERHTCSKSATATCDLKRPDFVILAYQEGEGKKKLREKFHHAPYFVEIPAEIYGRPNETSAYLIDGIKRAVKLAPELDKAFGAGCPLLLPPQNFGLGNVVGKLLDRVNGGAVPKKEAEQFRREFYSRERKAFKARSDLGFAIANGPLAHGQAKEHEMVEVALSSHYRLGCNYDDTLHWDVSLIAGQNTKASFSGKVVFYCRRGAPMAPSGVRNVNVLVDDCLR